MLGLERVWSFFSFASFGKLYFEENLLEADFDLKNLSKYSKCTRE